MNVITDMMRSSAHLCCQCHRNHPRVPSKFRINFYFCSVHEFFFFFLLFPLPRANTFLKRWSRVKKNVRVGVLQRSHNNTSGCTDVLHESAQKNGRKLDVVVVENLLITWKPGRLSQPLSQTVRLRRCMSIHALILYFQQPVQYFLFRSIPLQHVSKQLILVEGGLASGNPVWILCKKILWRAVLYVLPCCSPLFCCTLNVALAAQNSWLCRNTWVIP